MSKLEEELHIAEQKLNYPFITDAERRDYEVEIAWLQKQLQDKQKRKATSKQYA